MGEAEKKPKKQPALTWKAWLSFVVVGLAIVAVWYWMGVRNFSTFEQSEEASRFGESFGYVNALFSALALAGVVIAIVIQTKELGLQRDELEATREELSKSAEAQSQLVHLSALSALLQSYLDEYAAEKYQADNAFQEVVKHEPDKLADNLWYKILISRAELEAMRRGGRKNLAIDKINADIRQLRFNLWIREAKNFLDGCRQRVNGLAKSAPARGITSDIRDAIHGLCNKLNDLEHWFPVADDTSTKEEFSKINKDIRLKARGLSETKESYAESQNVLEALADFLKKIEDKYGAK